MRLTLYLLIGALSVGYAYAQVSTVVSGEYFFDSDPGFGQATALPAFTNGQSVDFSFLASSSGLTKGMHILGIRVLDSKNVWSIPVYTPVYVLASDAFTIRNISAAEYFFDSDPGIGNGNAIAVGSPAPVIDVNFAAASAGLSMGMHILAVRTQDIAGEWSIPVFTAVYVDGDRTITKLEYFFGNDPGVGNGTQVDVNPDTDVLDQIFSLNSSALAPATHTLSLRVAGSANLWSMAETASFVICSGATPSFAADVVCVGTATTLTDYSSSLPGDIYSWDFDDDGAQDDNTVGDVTFTYPTAGTHTARLTIDRGGCVATTTVTVTVDDVATADAGVDQLICATSTAAVSATVGGTASTGTWTTSGDGFFDNTSPTAVYTPGAADIGAGSATLTFTTQDPPGACNAVSAAITLTINPVATVNAGPDQDICGTSVALTGSVGGSATTATWTTAGDGTFDDANALNAVYTAGPNDLVLGNVDIHLTTDDPSGPCIEAGDELVVLFSNGPTVDAGADLTICGNAVATLNGSISGPATTFSWSTSGDGTFDDSAILNPLYTPGPNDKASGSAVLTLTSDAAGACAAQSSQLSLTVTRDIALATQTISSIIANTSFVTLTDGGTFNSGDVLTSSIAAGPTKGTAQLQANHTLQYTPSSGTVGNDTVFFQVCNQCGQCDSQYILFVIQNAAPVIDIPPAATNAGSTLVIPIASSISDENGNIDLSTATIVQQPLSGAVATIDINANLVLDYTGVPDYNGVDQLTIEVCDDLDACVQHILSVEVGVISGQVVVYNAVAPKSSGDNRFMRIMNLPQGNRVSIYNRWGDKVFEVGDYDNSSAGKRFEGNNDSGAALPSGIYFYKIEIPGTSGADGEVLTGYLALKQ